ncbi:MAG TPA: zinc-binding alcohol dehydrogenase family protein [Rubrobacteraceae bacterium]|nr:zinc-binding alcohol dehydrogenase family protein [Rubrobacteraceae bacterium]
MQAILIERFGDPSELRAVEVPRPQPGDGEVLVEVAAAAVNRSDVLNARGSFPFTTLPRIPGRDFAGVVVEGPQELVGREVWGTGGGELGFVRDGSHARYLALPANAVVQKSGTLSLEEAAACGLAYVTAGSAIVELGGVSSGETILVSGAAGGVGSAAAMIARWKGARVIGAVRDESERARAERAGVEVVVDTSREEVADAVLAATDGRGANLVLDAVGGPLFEPALNSLAEKGRMVVITTTPDKRHVSFDLLDFYRKSLRLSGLMTSFLDAEESAAVLRDLGPGFDAGALRAPAIAERYPMAQAGTAYARVESGEAAGRVLLVMG